MRRTLAVALAAPLALAVAPHAAAADGPPPIQACGSALTAEVLVDTSRFHEREFGFTASGNVVIRLSDEDSSVDVRAPGQLRLTEDPDTGLRTLVLSGRNLLIPESPGQAEALAEAGLPELPLITGRVVLTEQVDPETGGAVPGTEQVVSYTPHVTDVCALLAE